jgi:cation diffusion facilitator family transporter
MPSPAGRAIARLDTTGFLTLILGRSEMAGKRGSSREKAAIASKSYAAKLTLIVVIGLVAIKVAVVVITGSISILAQAVDSSLDLLAVVVTLVAIRIATKPADEEHPFGHGKVENIAAVVQAGLIFAVGGLIIYSAVERIITGARVELAEAGIAVMLVSMIASIFLSRYLFRVAKAVDSVAIQANAQIIAVDIYSTAAVLAALVAVRFTGLNILDPIIALGVVGLILKTGYDVLRHSFSGLIDEKLPEAEEDVIRACIAKYSYRAVAFHDLRTRKAGSYRYIDLHLVMPKNESVEEAHRVCDHLERDIKRKLPRAHITIHVEPCATPRTPKSSGGRKKYKGGQGQS